MTVSLPIARASCDLGTQKKGLPGRVRGNGEEGTRCGTGVRPFLG